ncbi:hypothetical protein BVRB_4g092450 [Beta vulgaris subsp. vulgaris]|nr:hypothetical protein BVRB_4g092450 [Beta vulgaris subsp. vulgaris]
MNIQAKYTGPVPNRTIMQIEDCKQVLLKGHRPGGRMFL